MDNTLIPSMADRQYYYIINVKNSPRPWLKLNRPLNIVKTTFGCQMNAHDQKTKDIWIL